MPMGKTNKHTPNNEIPSQGNDWVRTLSFAIIVVCIALLLALLGLMVWRATKNNPDVYRVIVTSDISPDSLKAYNYMDKAQADSLINSVIAYDEQLTKKYQYLVEQKEQDTQVFYWGSLIVGIVIAVFGWFGFQSFTTIEDKAKKMAGSVANRTAWTATQKYLKEEGKNQISEAAKTNLQDDTVKKVRDQVINELNTIIENRLSHYLPSNKVNELDSRVESLEKSIIPEIDKAVKDAVKEVMDKYRKASSNSSKKNKEEK